MIHLLVSLFLFLCVVFIVPHQEIYAHQPRIVDQNIIEVTDPSISKAYYGSLQGIPHIYRIKSNSAFNLYVNILVPDLVGQKNDVSVIILKNGNTEPVAILDAKSHEWKRFWEPFGRDWYVQGPEYKARVEQGEYEINVLSPNNDSAYSLAIGEIESFSFKDTIHAVSAIPKLKQTFFHESPIGFILSPFGWGYLAVVFVLSFLFGFLYRVVLRYIEKNIVRVRSKQILRSRKNIGTFDRIVRLAIGIGILLWAISTSWNPILIFISGFTFFEAIFSWCGVYAILGRNTCPI
jgi:hypothetical protein